MSGTQEELSVSLWRGGKDGRYQTYSVPRRESQTVLDVVTYVQRHIDPTLSYRFACRVGICGSCAMTVNGQPRWTCRTHVAKVAGTGRLEIGPLENLPVIKDLTTDMRPFFREMAAGQRRLRAVADAARTDCANPARQRRRASPPTQPSNASIAASATPAATRCAGTPTISARRRSIGPGRWSTIERDAGNRDAAASRRGGRRLPFLPLAPILPGALPADAQSDRRDRRSQAAHARRRI